MDEGIRKGKRKEASRGWTRDAKQATDLLENGEMELQGMIPWSSNYTYLTRVNGSDREMLAVYKPACGERPLWDFETGTLCQREVVASRGGRASR